MDRDSATPYRARIFGVILIAILIGSVGCASGNSNGDLGPDVPSQATQEMVDTIEAFWASAAQSDSAGMLTYVADRQPIKWVGEWRSAYDNFFEATKDAIEFEDAYYARSQTDTVTVQVRVPWVSCPPPAHAGERDRYYVEFISLQGLWRIVDIWKDIC